MIPTTAIGAFALIVLLFNALEGWVYRRPWVLLLAGLLVSGFSVLLKATPIYLKSVPGLPWSGAELDVAASVVDPTLIGLAGGLIASAFLLKLQVAHAAEVAAARDSVRLASDLVKHASRADEDLRLVALSLSNEEFNTRLRRVRYLQDDAFWAERDAREHLKRVDLPGVG